MVLYTSILVVKLGRLMLLYCALSPGHLVPDTFWPRCDKTGYRGLRTTKVQTSLRIRAD